MSALRGYYTDPFYSDVDYRRNLYWNVVTNKFYIRNVGFKPPRPEQCVLLGKYD